MLINDTKDFLASERWYAARGIPYRRGYLLYGELVIRYQGELRANID